MGELVLNEVEGKKFFTIKMIYFCPYPQYSLRAVGTTSRRPAFHSDSINRLPLKNL